VRLSKFIELNLEQIVSEWEECARTLLPNATVAILRDHAQAMLRAIAADMVTAQAPQQQRDKSHGLPTLLSHDGESAAQRHGTVGQIYSGRTTPKWVKFRPTSTLARYRRPFENDRRHHADTGRALHAERLFLRGAGVGRAGIQIFAAVPQDHARNGARTLNVLTIGDRGCAGSLSRPRCSVEACFGR
jgi:hypothetical protein